MINYPYEIKTDHSLQSNILMAIKNLSIWIEKNGWAGWDPYTIREHPLFLKINTLPRHQPLQALKYAVNRMIELFPYSIIRLYSMAKQINAKGMGLLAESYLILYQKTGHQHYLDRSIECLNWLEKNISEGYSGHCWGYPFDWASVKLIPKGTPSVVVTVTCGYSFLRAHETLKDPRYLDICNSITEFLVNDLKHQPGKMSDEICLSYTPLFEIYVHNASLFGADFLARMGSIHNDPKLLDLSQKVTNYTIRRQQEDGSFWYYGPEDPNKKNIGTRTFQSVDHYHTGFIIRCLGSIANISNDKTTLNSWEKAVEHYLKNFFTQDGRPKFNPNNPYPIDIHSCAEAILCLNHIARYNHNHIQKNISLSYLNKAVQYTLKNMLNSKSNYFIYRRYKYRVVDVPYLRWNQAWMLRALADIYQGLNG